MYVQHASQDEQRFSLSSASHRMLVRYFQAQFGSKVNLAQIKARKVVDKSYAKMLRDFRYELKARLASTANQTAKRTYQTMLDNTDVTQADI